MLSHTKLETMKRRFIVVFSRKQKTENRKLFKV